MTLGKAKLIQIILLVICCITFIIGLGLSMRAGEERAHDLSKVKVGLESKEVYFNPDERGYRNGAYHIRLHYVIQNNTRSTICTVYVETVVYDQNGKELGTIKTNFGEGSNEGLWLKPGQSVTLDSDFLSGVPVDDSFFIAFYENELSEFRIVNEATQARFEDGTYFQNGGWGS